MAEQTPPSKTPNLKPRGGGELKTPTTLDSKYKFDGLTYPDDLFKENNPYGDNYVVFFINVHKDSVLIKNDSANYVDASRQSERGAIQNLDGKALAAVGVVAAAGAVNAAGAAQKVAGNLSPVGATVTNLAAGGLLGGAIVNNIGGPKAQYKNQLKAIALHMPGDLSIKYGATWDSTSLAGTTALAMGMENATKGAILGGAGGAIIGAILGGKKGAVKGAAIGAAGGAAVGGAGVAVDYASNLAMQAPGAGEALSKTSGTAANPKKEQLFKEVDYRNFTFSYQFFPRSSDEAKSILNIIQEFKLHMHPEFRPGTNQFLYIYPSEFDIYYYHKGKENLNIHRHTSCVLTDMSVTYTPQGVFTSFADGMPTQINVSLSFRELALLTKENIMDGY